MCFKRPDPAKLQAEADARVKSERAEAEAEALNKTNSKLAQRNRSRAASSLLAQGMDTTTSEVSALGGKTKLGQ